MKSIKNSCSSFFLFHCKGTHSNRLKLAFQNIFSYVSGLYQWSINVSSFFGRYVVPPMLIGVFGSSSQSDCLLIIPYYFSFFTAALVRSHSGFGIMPTNISLQTRSILEIICVSSCSFSAWNNICAWITMDFDDRH